MKVYISGRITGGPCCKELGMQAVKDERLQSYS